MSNQYKESFADYGELPIMLNAKQVQNVLGISRSATYNLLNSDSFPKIKIGTRIVVPRAEFLKWIDRQLQTQLAAVS